MRRFLRVGVIAVLRRNSWRFSSKETIDGTREVTGTAEKSRDTQTR
jgi:hypothetical protein